MDVIDKHVRINTLLSFYGSLLTDKQYRVMHYYYEENYTLGEIAEILSVSRNAVHDQMSKTVKKLEDYETKLKLKEKHDAKEALIVKLEKTVDTPQAKALLAKLKDVE